MDVEWMRSTIVHDSCFSIGVFKYTNDFKPAMDMYVYIYIYIYYMHMYMHMYMYMQMCMYMYM